MVTLVWSTGVDTSEQSAVSLQEFLGLALVFGIFGRLTDPSWKGGRLQTDS